MNFGYNDDFMACPTLECVLRPNACEINRPASTVFWRSTPFWKKKRWTVYKAIYLQILCNFMITDSCHPCQTTHCILFLLDICQHLTCFVNAPQNFSKFHFSRIRLMGANKKFPEAGLTNWFSGKKTLKYFPRSRLSCGHAKWGSKMLL